jgi:hypothetical protein
VVGRQQAVIVTPVAFIAFGTGHWRYRRHWRGRRHRRGFGKRFAETGFGRRIAVARRTFETRGAEWLVAAVVAARGTLGTVWRPGRVIAAGRALGPVGSLACGIFAARRPLSAVRRLGWRVIAARALFGAEWRTAAGILLSSLAPLAAE